MRFRAHETFSIRKGWLYKGLKNIKEESSLFSNRDINASDILGIGTNMVRSLRYWLQAVNLTNEEKHKYTTQEPTALAEIIWENDRYIEELGTLCILHYCLATNIDKATSWYYFFNEFQMIEFSRDDFVNGLSNYAKINNCEVAESSYEGDYHCIINTYLARTKIYPEKFNPEDNLDCPFAELGLIEVSDKTKRIFRKVQPAKDVLHPLILLAIIINQSSNQKEIKISSLLRAPGNIGRVFNLDIISLTNYLYLLQQRGYIRVIRTAGLDVIEINTNMNYFDCINAYYTEINAI